MAAALPSQEVKAQNTRPAILAQIKGLYRLVFFLWEDVGGTSLGSSMRAEQVYVSLPLSISFSCL